MVYKIIWIIELCALLETFSKTITLNGSFITLQKFYKKSLMIFEILSK